jgi:hypothetical protein
MDEKRILPESGEYGANAVFHLQFPARVMRAHQLGYLDDRKDRGKENMYGVDAREAQEDEARKICCLMQASSIRVVQNEPGKYKEELDCYMPIPHEGKLVSWREWKVIQDDGYCCEASQGFQCSKEGSGRVFGSRLRQAFRADLLHPAIALLRPCGAFPSDQLPAFLPAPIG